MKLTIGHLYPDLLNLYGDRGNIQCLRKRLEWRGIEAEVIPFISGDTIDFSKLDVVLLGGGSDREQELVCSHLQKIREDFRTYVEEDGVVLAVCGGYQLLGHYYKTQTKTIEGLGILDIKTEWEPERLIRNIVLDSPLFDTPVVGFENHGRPHLYRRPHAVRKSRIRSWKHREVRSGGRNLQECHRNISAWPSASEKPACMRLSAGTCITAQIRYGNPFRAASG